MTDKTLKNIVILTGAGISAESGIPVFRSESGLWENERIEDVCVPEALKRDPQKVHNLINCVVRSWIKNLTELIWQYRSCSVNGRLFQAAA